MIKDIIRLKWEGKLSHEQIAAALAVSTGVVNKYVGLAAAAGLDWETIRAWDERQLLARLLPRSASATPYVEPNWGRIHQELSRVVLYPALRRPANTSETAETSQLPVLVSIALHAARARREVLLGEASYIEARSAMTVVAGRDEIWMEVEGKRQVLKTGTQIAMDAVKRLRILSRHGYDSIDVERAYVVQPLSISLPRVPKWLRRAIHDLAGTARILIDDRETAAQSILVSVADFAQALEFLEAQLSGDPRPDRLVAYRLSDIAKVKRSRLILESILNKPTVSGLDTTPGHACAE